MTARTKSSLAVPIAIGGVATILSWVWMIATHVPVGPLFYVLAFAGPLLLFGGLVLLAVPVEWARYPLVVDDTKGNGGLEYDYIQSRFTPLGWAIDLAGGCLGALHTVLWVCYF